VPPFFRLHDTEGKEMNEMTRKEREELLMLEVIKRTSNRVPLEQAVRQSVDWLKHYTPQDEIPLYAPS
jgi:hypothetical protein